LHGTIPWRAFSSIIGALAVFVSFACLFISFEIYWRYFFSIARACFAALTTLGVLRPVAQQVNDHPFDCFNTIKILSE